MPTYEYECTHCGYGFEAFQKINDKPLDTCPKCSHKLRRLIGAGSGIIFKQNACPKTKEGCDGCPHA